MLANTTRHCKSSFDLFGLPADIACLAISYLSPHDLLCAFSQVSRAAHSLAYCPAAWHEVHITRPPPAPSAPLTQSRSGTGSASGSGPAPGAGAAARRSGVGDACSHVSLDDAALHTLLVRRGSWSRLRVLHLDASSALTDAAAESIELFAAGAVGVGCEWERPRSDSGASTAESGDQESHSKALLRFSTPIGEATSADSDGASDVGDTICGDISGGGGMLPLLNDLSLASCQWLRARSTLCALVNAAPGLTALDISNAREIDTGALVRGVFCHARVRLRALNLGQQTLDADALRGAAPPPQCLALHSLIELRFPFSHSLSDAALAYFCEAVDPASHEHPPPLSASSLSLRSDASFADIAPISSLLSSASPAPSFETPSLASSSSPSASFHSTFASSSSRLCLLDLTACVRVTSHALALHVAAHCPRLRTLTLTRCDAIDRIPREIVAQCREIEAVALPHRCANGETLQLLRSLPALRRAAFALGARPTVDQFTAPLLRALLLARPRLRVELRVCAIVHAQLAADIGVLQRELMMAATTIGTTDKSAVTPSAHRPTMNIRAMTSMTRNAMHSLSGGGVESASAACSPSLLDRSQRHAARPCVEEEDQTLDDGQDVQAMSAATASNQLLQHHASTDIVLLRLVNLHDCAEHGGFVGSSRGPFHQQQQQQQSQQQSHPPMPSESQAHSPQQPPQVSFRPTRHPLHRLSLAGAH